MNERIYAWKIEIENEKEGFCKIKIDFTFVWFFPPQTNTLTHTFMSFLCVHIIGYIKSDYLILNVIKMWRVQ